MVTSKISNAGWDAFLTTSVGTPPAGPRRSCETDRSNSTRTRIGQNIRGRGRDAFLRVYGPAGAGPTDTFCVPGVLMPVLDS